MFLAKLIVISSILSYGVHYSMGLKCYDCTLRPCAPNNMTSALQVDCLANEKYCMNYKTGTSNSLLIQSASCVESCTKGLMIATKTKAVYEVHIHCCQNDLCNQATKKNYLKWILIVSLFIFLTKYV